MYYKIENEFFTAEIDDLGCQLHSFRAKADGFEYLWQGNPEIWYGQAPVLFPVIGQLIDDRFRYNGKEYSVPKHGLARKLPFNVKDVSGNRAVMSLESTAETLEKYPFDFELEIIHELVDKKLVVTHNVVNKTDGEMYFSIGAHPGFNFGVGCDIEFEKPETLVTERIDSENLIIDEKFPVIENETTIRITPDLFNNDALILSGISSEKLSLKGNGRELEFVFGNCPFLGIWAKPNAPYVCIEPWYGVNDSHEVKDDISQKRGIRKLEKGEKFSFVWTAEIK